MATATARRKQQQQAHEWIDVDGARVAKGSRPALVKVGDTVHVDGVDIVVTWVTRQLCIGEDEGGNEIAAEWQYVTIMYVRPAL
jgi:hypothetical protein